MKAHGKCRRPRRRIPNRGSLVARPAQVAGGDEAGMNGNRQECSAQQAPLLDDLGTGNLVVPTLQQRISHVGSICPGNQGW